MSSDQQHSVSPKPWRYFSPFYHLSKRYGRRLPGTTLLVMFTLELSLRAWLHLLSGLSSLASLKTRCLSMCARLSWHAWSWFMRSLLGVSRHELWMDRQSRRGRCKAGFLGHEYDGGACALPYADHCNLCLCVCGTYASAVADREVH